VTRLLIAFLWFDAAFAMCVLGIWGMCIGYRLVRLGVAGLVSGLAAPPPKPPWEQSWDIMTGDVRNLRDRLAAASESAGKPEKRG
jgi:hypothetical protein